jgi:hypothetical protein
MFHTSSYSVCTTVAQLPIQEALHHSLLDADLTDVTRIAEISKVVHDIY